MDFALDRYGQEIAQMLAEAWLNELGPGRPRAQQTKRVMQLTHASLGQPVVDSDMADCCLAAVRLRFDLLDESHELSQQIQTPAGSYWHGIMHRREGDFGNAKYWFRNAGPQPALESMDNELAKLLDSSCEGEVPGWVSSLTPWAPFAFVDICQAAQAGELEQIDLARQVALLEWQFLFDACYHEAIGEN